MSDSKLSYNMKCVACVSTLREAPSRLRLSVRQPGQGCLPWWSKKHTVATLCFKEALWRQGPSGEYEQSAECEVKEVARLRLLEADLPVKGKWWSKGGHGKMLLQASLGTLLDHLEGSPASEAWLALTATGLEVRVRCQPEEDQGGAGDPLPHSYDALMNAQDSPMEYDHLWEEIPLEEEEEEEEEKEASGRWRTPWAWTSLDDLLSLGNTPWAWTSLDDLLSLGNLLSPWGTEKWRGAGAVEQTNAGAPVTCPTDRAEEQDTGLLPPYWDMPGFPACTASPGSSGESDEGVPAAALPAPTTSGVADSGPLEATLPDPLRRGGAVRGSTGRRAVLFRCVVVCLVYLSFVLWVVTCGDDFLDAMAGLVEGWLHSASLSGHFTGPTQDL